MRRLLPPLVMLSMVALLTACPDRTSKDPSEPGPADDGGECPVCECEQATTGPVEPGTPEPEPKV